MCKKWLLFTRKLDACCQVMRQYSKFSHESVFDRRQTLNTSAMLLEQAFLWAVTRNEKMRKFDKKENRSNLKKICVTRQ